MKIVFITCEMYDCVNGDMKGKENSGRKCWAIGGRNGEALVGTEGRKFGKMPGWVNGYFWLYSRYRFSTSKIRRLIRFHHENLSILS